MKTSRPALPGSVLALALVLAAGCSKERQVTTATAPGQSVAPPALSAIPPVAPATIDPLADMQAALEGATLEQHEGLGDIQRRMDQEIEAQVAARKAIADVSLETDKKLDSATEDFAEKLRALSMARPETWNSAKHDAELAFQNVRSAFASVMNSPARK